MRSIKKFLLKKKSHLRKMIASRKKLLIITFFLFVAFGSLSFFSFQGNQSTPPSVPSSSELGIAAFSPLGESGGSVVPASCPSDLHDAPANYGQACGCHNAGSIQCGGACSTSACASCYPFGVEISGEYGTMNYFNTSSVISPDTCANHAGTFTCDNGTLLGYNPSMSYFQTCSVTSPPPPSSCTFSGSVSWPPGCGATVSGSLPDGASTTVTNTNAGYSGSKNYSCSNGTWIAGSESCTPDAGPGPIAPTLTLTANPASIVSGSSTLTWSTTNATSCFATGGWTGWKTVNGSLAVSPVATTTYTLECWSSSGVSSGQRSATVTVSAVAVPGPTTLTFTANPTSIASGGSSTLTWSTTNAASCWAVGGNGWTGWKTVNGSFVVSPVVDTTYYLECFDISDVYATGQKNVTVTVTPVAPAPTLTFVANPTSVSSGGGSTLTWNTTNAVSCTASGDWSGAKAVSDNQTQSNITTDKTYTLVCQNSVGTTVSRTVTVTVTAGPLCTPDCSAARTDKVCSGQSFSDTCSGTCTGTRYCDFNWKEVAP